MIRRAFWHMQVTELLTRVALVIGAAILGSLGLHVSSPVIVTVIAASVFLLVYRLKYKHL